MTTSDIVYFFPFRFENQSGRLWREDEERVLRPKTAAVLHYLVTHAGQVVSKDELLMAVWPEVIVSEAVLTVCISELRQALADDPQQPRFIATVHRHGYRFIAPFALPPPSSLESRVQRLGAEGQKGASPVQTLDPRRQTLDVPFVGREAELVQLQQWWDLALSGQRQVVFIAGEPGIGKTTLVDRFLARLIDEHEHEFWIGRGQCVEQYGEGEAYLPVLEALGHLCRGPEGRQVQEVLHRYAPTWLLQMPGLQEAEEMEALRLRTAGATRERMLREMADAVEALTTERGLVLACEDLHASDRSTVELLAYLAQRRGTARLLILGTYRSAEVIVRAHPLRQVMQELHGRQQCQYLPLDLLSHAAVGDYLAQRLAPGLVSPSLTAEVYQKTEGNALFMVTVVEYVLQQELLYEENGLWRLRGNLQSIGVPESARQLIEQQIEQLSDEARRVLEVASIAGVEFSAAAVSAGLTLETSQAEPSQVEERCERLSRHTPFLRVSGSVEWPDGTVTMRYGFHHALYQEVAYERTSPGRRSQLHQRVGERLAIAYGQRAGDIAAELAMHFERGRDAQRAVQYYQQAGEKALQRHAYREAIEHVEKGLALFQRLPASPEHVHLELLLHVTHGAALLATKGFGAPDVEQIYTRARALSQQLEDTATLVPVLCGLWNFYLTRAEFLQVRDLADQLLALAQRQPDPVFLLQAHNVRGQTAMFMGEPAAAQMHIEQNLALYKVQTHGTLAAIYGEDPGVVCHMYAALTRWLLGYPNQAVRHLAQGLHLAQTLGHPFGVAQMLWMDGVVSQSGGDSTRVHEHTQTLISLCQKEDFPIWLVGGRIVQGWALTVLGQWEHGISQIRQGLDDWHAMEMGLILPYNLALLAAAYGKSGRVEEGLHELTEALEIVNTTGERWYEAELWRLKGELLLAQAGDRLQAIGHREKTEEAEGHFHKALEIARRQQAKSLELRATVSLARLWQQQGKQDEARQMLAEIYSWFTEGFDTKDLQEAKALLAELSPYQRTPKRPKTARS